MKNLSISLLMIPILSFPCTTILVDSKASDDGSQIIARNVDHDSLTNQHYFYHKPGENAGKIFHSTFNNFTYPNSKQPLGFTAFSKAVTNNKSWGSAGFNDLGVGMTGTESIYSSHKLDAIDPYLKETGINEDSVVHTILPRIHSAKEGAQLLGKIIETQGSAEGMGVAFIDSKEIWYLETGSAHQWLARRLPKGKYFITANQGRLRKYDPNDKENCLASKNLIDFAIKNKLIQSDEEFNFEKAYMRHEDGNNDYNYPRVYTIQKMFTTNNNSLSQPEKFKVFETPDNTIGIEDVKKALRSHYDNTEHDPYSNENPKEPFRPASVFRTYESHILQIRKNLPDALAHITYISWGMGDLSVYIPFYKDAAIPDMFNKGKAGEADHKSAYWKLRRVQTLAMQNYNEYAPIVKKEYQQLEQKQKKEMTKFEAQYTKLYKSSPSQAKKMLDQFQKKLAYQAIRTAKKLENILMTKLTHETDQKYRFPGL